MNEYFKEMMLGICFWLIINMDILFTFLLIAVTLIGSYHLGQKDKTPVMGILMLTGGVLGSTLLYMWIFDYPVWPLWR